MPIKRNYTKLLIIGLLIIIPVKSHAQGIIKYEKKLSDTTDIVFIGKLDTIQKRSIDIHYLLLRKRSLALDTIWKTHSGSLENDYIQISDLSLTKDTCAFLLSTAFGIELIINSRILNSSNWMVSCSKYIVMNVKSMKLKKISLINVKTVRCEYISSPPEVYKVDNGKLRKYLESTIEGKTNLQEVEIKDNEQGFIELK